MREREGRTEDKTSALQLTRAITIDEVRRNRPLWATKSPALVTKVSPVGMSFELRLLLLNDDISSSKYFIYLLET